MSLILFKNQKEIEEYGKSIPKDITYDDEGRILSYKISNTLWYKKTYDVFGYEASFVNSDGFAWEVIYNDDGYPSSYKNSDGYSWAATYDENNVRLTLVETKPLK